jgi:hypothetical protein
VVVVRKPVPFTVRVSGPDPATVVVGVTEVTVGDASVGGGVGAGEFEEDPPQPVRNKEGKRIKQETCNEQTFIVGQF